MKRIIAVSSGQSNDSQNVMLKRSTTICFCLDENVDQRIVVSLHNRGIEVITSTDLELTGTKDDSAYLSKAIELCCPLVTGDQDFGVINKRWLEEGKHHPGIIFISSARPRSPGELARKLIEIYETKKPGDMADLFLPV